MNVVARYGLLRAFTSLRHRNYRLYWFGQVISLIGSWMQAIGQAWLVLELTHSAWQLGLVGALLSLLVAGAGWMWRKPAEKNVAESARL